MSHSDASPVGLTGRIVTATRGASGAGEVLLHIRGGTEIFLARSDEPLTVGESVIVVEETGPRTVVVVPWTDPTGGMLNG